MSLTKLIVLILAVSSLTACLDLGSQKGSYKELPKGVSISASRTLLADKVPIVNVADGDTLTVLGPDQHTYKLRLQGIDAPEKKQAFGQVCKDTLKRSINNQMANVEVYKQDRYGRLVAKVIVNGKDLALEQIKTGCGWHYLAYEKEQPARDRKAYAQAEAKARANELGLWQDSKPIPPWDFRAQQRH